MMMVNKSLLSSSVKFRELLRLLFHTSVQDSSYNYVYEGIPLI